MNAPERFFQNAVISAALPDIQASADHRQLAIQKVGVKGLRYPCACGPRCGAATPPSPRSR